MPIEQLQQQDGRFGRLPDAALILGKGVDPAAEDIGRFRLLEAKTFAYGAQFPRLPGIDFFHGLFNFSGEAFRILTTNGFAFATIRTIPARQGQDCDDLAFVWDLLVSSIHHHIPAATRTALSFFYIFHWLFLLKLNNHRAFAQGDLDVGSFAVRAGGVIHVLPQSGVVDRGHRFVKHASRKRKDDINRLITRKTHGSAVDLCRMGKCKFANFGNYRFNVSQFVVWLSLFHKHIITFSVIFGKLELTISVSASRGMQNNNRAPAVISASPAVISKRSEKSYFEAACMSG